MNPNANTSLGLTGASNPGSDLVNKYGDESPNRQTLTLNGKKYVVSQTGYFENETTDLTFQNLRGDAAVFWRIRPSLTVSYQYKAATFDNICTGRGSCNSGIVPNRVSVSVAVRSLF